MAAHTVDFGTMADNVNFSDIWLTVSYYNEGQATREVPEHAREALPNIVAVNDSSSDNSSSEIHRAGAHLANHPVNLGQGTAIQTNVEYAHAQTGPRYLITSGADGQHQVEDVVTMV